ncbi:MAG: trigger factor, partial [Candidatus Gastranaerophilales bacterium]|nr:trigger factor [Candidatus Gastranaerophilales bacterium]
MTIPAAEATSAYNTAASKIAQYINVDGFRKGKAPRAVVERHVGVDRIRQEALEILLPKYLGQAVYDNKLDIITQPAITDYKFETGKDVEITFEVETRPEVTLGSYKGLDVKVEVPAADDNAFDKALEGFLTQHASMELVLDRPSSETDTVVFDFDGTCNGEPIQGGSAKGYALDLAHSNFIPGFAEQLVGHNIKDEFDIQVTFPEEYHDEKLKGQPATFAIKINEIKQRILPELTDEFVKKSSRFATVDELKADIKDYVDNQRENIKKVNAENAVFKSVIESASVEIPQGMINREVESLKADYQQRLSYQGINWEDFVKSQGEEFEKTLAEDAVTRIKNSLIIDKISKEVDIKVEQADFQTKIAQMAGAYGVGPQDLLKQFGQNPDFLSSLSQQIVNDKVRDYLLANNNIEYVEVKEKVEA